MAESSERLKKIFDSYRQKNPSYSDILNFFEKIREQQESFNRNLSIPKLENRKISADLEFKEGFPLINREGFSIDLEASATLFASLCMVGKTANEKMRKNIHSIELAIEKDTLDIKNLLLNYYDTSYVEKTARENMVDTQILNFLVHMAVQPSIYAHVQSLKNSIPTDKWLRGYCPVCGSLPGISELKGDGQRYFLCSFCNFEWPGERLKCPFCENGNHEKLHYSYEERKEYHRLDMCDACKSYIKTIDSRKLNYEPDLMLEDITTSHLDFIASEKGFKRPSANFWGF